MRDESLPLINLELKLLGPFHNHTHLGQTDDPPLCVILGSHHQCLLDSTTDVGVG